MSSESLPPIDPEAQNAINQLGKDEDQLGQYKKQMTDDINNLKMFLYSLDGIVKKDGAGVALMMLMSRGFNDIDEVKNDNFTAFSAKLNVCTDYQTMGTLSESYLNAGGSAIDTGKMDANGHEIYSGGVTKSQVYSLYILLQQLQGAKNDPNLDSQTGGLISSSADSLMGKLFDAQDPNGLEDEIAVTQDLIDSNWSTPDGATKQTEGTLVKTCDDQEDQISQASSSASQMLQTKASVASNSYKSYLGVETKNFTNWSTLVGDINRKTSQSG